MPESIVHSIVSQVSPVSEPELSETMSLVSVGDSSINTSSVSFTLSYFELYLHSAQHQSVSASRATKPSHVSSIHCNYYTTSLIDLFFLSNYFFNVLNKYTDRLQQQSTSEFLKLGVLVRSAETLASTMRTQRP